MCLHAGWFEDTLPIFLCRTAAAKLMTDATTAEDADATAKAVAAAAAAPAAAPAAAAAAVASAAAGTLHVSFLHIDCDLYSSTKTVLTQLSPAIRAGTVVVFDEYCGYDGWEDHEARAWSEFCSECAVSFEWIEPPPAAKAKGERNSSSGRDAADAASSATGEGGPGPSKAVVVTGRKRREH